MRKVLVALGALVVLGSSVTTARADEPPPSCETVTTIRCAGAAPVTVAPPVESPPVAPPSFGHDEDCCAPIAPAPPMRPAFDLPPDWQLGRDEHGQLYAEVHKRGRASVWAPGLALWIGTYVTTAAVGGVVDRNPIAAIPIFGGFVSAGAYGLFGNGGNASQVAGYAMSSVLQIGGLVTFIVGAASGNRLERLPVKLSPYGIYGRF
jgi:hypothetical protein